MINHRVPTPHKPADNDGVVVTAHAGYISTVSTMVYPIGPIYLTSIESLDGTLRAACDVPVCLVPSDVETIYRRTDCAWLWEITLMSSSERAGCCLERQSDTMYYVTARRGRQEN